MTAIARIRELVRYVRPESGWIYRDARFLAARVELDPVAARVLPRGLSLSSPPRATVFVAHFPDTSFRSIYNEAGVFLHVRRWGSEAIHCPWMLVDDDVALITGRELLGYPKKLGRIELREVGTRVHAEVERKGDRVLEMTATLGESDPTPPPMEGQTTYNVLGSIGFSVQRLVKFAPREQILEARRARVELVVHRAERDPICDLGLGPVTSAHYYRLNLGAGVLPRPVAAVSPTYWVTHWTLRCH